MFSRGPNFREPNPVDWNKAKTVIMISLHDNIDTFCEKNSANKAAFAAWESSIEQAINLKIENLQPKFHNHSNTIPVLQSSRKASKEIQQTYVIMPIDKASGNIALVCKRIYAKVLVSELGLI